MRAELTLHPDSRCDAVESIVVTVERSGRALSLEYEIAGTIADIRMPEKCRPERTDGLWQHLCFEAFVRDEAGEGYCEFNFSPSTQWAAYRFTAYRMGMQPLGIEDPKLATVVKPNRLTLAAELDLPGAGRMLGLSAVIEETNGRKSYWALAHAPGKPDFHHPDCFVLQLPARNAS